MQRIKEHWRIKDGRGQIQYPRSSFTIDCTGWPCVVAVTMVRKKRTKLPAEGKVLVLRKLELDAVVVGNKVHQFNNSNLINKEDLRVEEEAGDLSSVGDMVAAVEVELNGVGWLLNIIKVAS